MTFVRIFSIYVIHVAADDIKLNTIVHSAIEPVRLVRVRVTQVAPSVIMDTTCKKDQPFVTAHELLDLQPMMPLKNAKVKLDSWRTYCSILNRRS